MAFTFKSRRCGYDNIAVGSATGKENIVAVTTVGRAGETSRLTLSQRGTSTSVLSQAGLERCVGGDGGTVSDNARIGLPTSSGVGATSPYHASATSNTSAFQERL